MENSGVYQTWSTVLRTKIEEHMPERGDAFRPHMIINKDQSRADGVLQCYSKGTKKIGMVQGMMVSKDLMMRRKDRKDRIKIEK
jgi:hypothetical protein